MDMTTNEVDPAFTTDVMRCFEEQIYAIPARWLYDRRGSELFVQITELPEYYPTRTETRLLENYSAQVADISGTGRVVVEFGSGSSTKTPYILRETRPAAYVPVDISGEFLAASAAQLQTQFPELPIYPLEIERSLRVRRLTS